MTKGEALNVVDKIVSDYRGTRQDHTMLMQAVGVIKTALFPPANKKASVKENPITEEEILEDNKHESD